MKYLLLLLLASCTSMSKCPDQPVYQYKCVIYGGHGTFGEMSGDYHSEVEAEEDAEKLRLTWVKAGKISENTASWCERDRTSK